MDTLTDVTVWCVVCGRQILVGPNGEAHFTDPRPKYFGATVHAGWCEDVWRAPRGTHSPVFSEPVYPEGFEPLMPPTARKGARR